MAEGVGMEWLAVLSGDLTDALISTSECCDALARMKRTATGISELNESTLRRLGEGTGPNGERKEVSCKALLSNKIKSLFDAKAKGFRLEQVAKTVVSAVPWLNLRS